MKLYSSLKKDPEFLKKYDDIVTKQKGTKIVEEMENPKVKVIRDDKATILKYAKQKWLDKTVCFIFLRN